ncbi:MAG: sulfite exporter TauE/SafE family protein [Actinobacteria bacterium]|nr:sulfite exporter TauE/SafE family protein [Actinomycetota bacterium]
MRNRNVVIVGLAAGLLSGIFGVGGGVLIVPGLMLVAKMEQRRAHGTSLAAVLPIAITGLVTYLTYDNVDWWAAACLMVGALPGALLGTKWLATVNKKVLTWLFIVVALASAVRLFFGIDTSQTADHSLGLTISLVVVGFVSGVLAGLLGIGGGIVMVPALMLLGGISAVLAKGTSLAAIVPTSVMGTWRNRKSANVDVRAGATIGIAGAATAVVGGVIAEALPERAAAVSFAVLMVAVCARLALAMRQKAS